MTLRILLIGGSGQVGWELARALQPIGEVHAPPRKDLDLCDADQCADWLRRVDPRIVVNAAAFTMVDRAETERDEALRVNGTAVGALAAACEARGCLLVHYSTDYVFDGQKGAPYVEDDPPGPLNAYGVSKLMGERALRATACPHLLIRLGWIYSVRRVNFLRAVVARARREPAIDVVDDQFGGPTPAWLVADSTAQLLRRWLDLGASPTERALLHLGCSGSATRHEFALAILESLTTHPARMEEFRLERMPEVRRTSSAAFGDAARRPADSRLAVDRIALEWGIAAPDWRTALRLTLRAV